MRIIGRKFEQKQLQKIFQSDMAEFVAVYGRRRVGKTYLVREFFNEKKCLFFRASGIHKGPLKIQLNKFKQEIENTFYKAYKGTRLSPFTNWHEAFAALKDAIDLYSGHETIVLFFDEVPWMATPKSGFLEAIDYYWNRYWSENKRIKLIICGSAASWIIDNILHNTGGLHNRITLRLRIEPFNLSETKAYLSYKNIHYNAEQILMLYLCLGGIPFYLNALEKTFSAVQNINLLCFNKNGALYDEFNLLFASLFKKHEEHEKIISLVASKRNGISRRDIESALHYKGGGLTQRLNELEEASFIIPFTPWKKERGICYKVIDEYTLFYLTWIAPKAANRISKHMTDDYWQVLSTTPSWQAWSGYAFESICFKHLHQIRKALHIPNGSEATSFNYSANKKSDSSGIQIDLVFDRPDNTINLCEIKYCSSPFILDKKYAQHLLDREKIYCKITQTRKQIFHSMIASGGLKKTLYSKELIASVAVLSDLFKE